MRKSHDELRQISQEGHERKVALDRKITLHQDSRMAELQDRFDSFRAKIQALRDKKDELLRLPNTVEETVRSAKESLRAQRRDYIQKILGAHLKDIQAGKDHPFNPLTFKVHTFDVGNCWQLAFFAFNEKDIEEAAAELDASIGIDEEKREAEIKKVDRQILQLEKELESEL
jgi:hypothetical protein